MDTRKEQLLTLVIENYIETADPVASQFLVESGGLDVSGATVRNELRDLEEQGYLTHPHTSAGRIPTEAGYEYYVLHLMKPWSLSKKMQEAIHASVHVKSDESTKAIAKYVAGEVKNAVIVAWDKSRVYYTGISYLFSQPEFLDADMTVNVSSIFDHCEDRLNDLYDAVEEGKPTTRIGKANPFGRACGLVGTRVGETLFTVIGPMRMDYKKASALVDFIAKETV